MTWAYDLDVCGNSHWACGSVSLSEDEIPIGMAYCSLYIFDAKELVSLIDLNFVFEF